MDVTPGGGSMKCYCFLIKLYRSQDTCKVSKVYLSAIARINSKVTFLTIATVSCTLSGHPQPPTPIVSYRSAVKEVAAHIIKVHFSYFWELRVLLYLVCVQQQHCRSLGHTHTLHCIYTDLCTLPVHPPPFCCVTHSKGHSHRNAWRTDGVKPTPCLSLLHETWAKVCWGPPLNEIHVWGDKV